MSKMSKNKSIADKINEFLAPKALLDPEKEQDDTNCQFSEFDNEGYDKVPELGQIRKRNVKSLDEVDAKYKGVLSRRSLDDSDDDSEENEAEESVDNESEGEYQSGSDEFDEENSDQDEEEDSEAEDDGNMFPDSNADDDQEADAEAPTILPAQPASNETYQKSVSVKNQLEIWEKLLEVRIKSHKLLLTANSLPLPDTHERLAESEEFANATEKTFQGVEKLLTQLQSFQQLMCSRFPETKELTLTPAGKKRKSTSKAAPESKVQRMDTVASAVTENYNTFWTYSQPVLQKWHDRTNVLAISKAKHVASNTNLLKNIEDSLINRAELVKKTRAYRGGYDVFDWKNSLHMFANDEGNSVIEADLVGDGLQDPANKLTCPEIFDDSEFYHQLLRELIQSKTEEGQGQLEIAKKYQELQKLRGKMKKTVDTRASKGRKIRYVVHNKMMNFMAPTVHEQWADEAKDELYSSLFGLADKMK